MLYSTDVQLPDINYAEKRNELDISDIHPIDFDEKLDTMIQAAEKQTNQTLLGGLWDEISKTSVDHFTENKILYITGGSIILFLCVVIAYLIVRS